MGSLGMVNFPRSMKNTSANSFFCSGVQLAAASASTSNDLLKESWAFSGAIKLEVEGAVWEYPDPFSSNNEGMTKNLSISEI